MQAAREAAKAAWLRLWQPCCIMPGTPEAMQQWRHNHREIVRLSQFTETARRRSGDLANRRDRARKSLAELVPPISTDESVASLLRRAEQQCRTLEQAEAAYSQLQQGAAREVESPKESEREIAAAEAALEAWQAEWAPAVAAALALPADTPVEIGQSALDAWGRVAELARAWRSDSERISQMREAIAGFNTESMELRQRLGDDSDDPPTAFVARRRVASMKPARTPGAQATCRTTLSSSKRRATKPNESFADAETELAQMRSLAGVETDSELRQVVERALERQTLEGETQRLKRHLLEQGEGYEEQALCAEAAASEIDAVVARISEIDRELLEVVANRDKLNEERLRAADRIAAKCGAAGVPLRTRSAPRLRSRMLWDPPSITQGYTSRACCSERVSSASVPSSRTRCFGGRASTSEF